MPAELSQRRDSNIYSADDMLPLPSLALHHKSATMATSACNKRLGAPKFARVAHLHAEYTYRKATSLTNGTTIRTMREGPRSQWGANNPTQKKNSETAPPMFVGEWGAALPFNAKYIRNRKVKAHPGPLGPLCASRSTPQTKRGARI